jgi:MoaA/NifB/PqqE/SkfB family radical SAM enzyme
MKQYFRSPTTLPGYKCLVGETNLAISPYGEVRLCYQMEPVGNVRESPLRSLWSGTPAIALRGVIDGCRRSCSIMNCNYNEG